MVGAVRFELAQAYCVKASKTTEANGINGINGFAHFR